MLGVAAEESQVLGEVYEAAVEGTVAVRPLGRAEQPTAGYERVGGRVEPVGCEGGQAGVDADAVGDVVQGPAGRDLRVGQFDQLGQAQCREAGEQQLFAQGEGRLGGGFFAVRVGDSGAVPGILYFRIQ
ncbi:hypothetical protein [Streptomyces filamentosus]|uniref:hypothetical protein n=1 Tax=Streptomyces filamentosus TaxID=67294 RepID=UPI00332EB410